MHSGVPPMRLATAAESTFDEGWRVLPRSRKRVVMIAVVERDRRLGRRLAAALAARGCDTRVVHGYREGKALLGREIPDALYVSEALQRASGGDLLADVDRDDR